MSHSIFLGLLTTLYNTYHLLYCTGCIQMISNYSTKDVETEKNGANITFNTSRIYTTLYNTYHLLYYKGHIQMTSNYSTIDVETENNGVKKC